MNPMCDFCGDYPAIVTTTAGPGLGTYVACKPCTDTFIAEGGDTSGDVPLS